MVRFTNSQELPKALILHSQAEFEELFKTGKRVYGQYVFMAYKPWYPVNGTSEPSRVAFVAGRRIGNAAVRNLCKRRMREIFRKNKPLFLNFRVLIVAQAAIPRASFEELNHDMLSTAGKMTT